VIAAAKRRHHKELWSSRGEGATPQLVCCYDESEQATFVAEKVLEHRESGIGLKRQAVLFRASHHALVLETELARRKIPYVKYGGLKFLEAAHIKDLMAILRIAENPRDLISGMRMLQLLPGVGPRIARKLLELIGPIEFPLVPWRDARVPAECRAPWLQLLDLLDYLRTEPAPPLAAQIHAIREFYEPCVDRLYDAAGSRKQDLEQMEVVASRYDSRRTMLTELTLDPPNSTEDLAANPLLDEDYLILSTMHSAKGLEFDVVYVIHAADGNIPSDMATGSAAEIEEERRLLYVACTRARAQLYVSHPLRYYTQPWAKADTHGYAQRSRFLADTVRTLFEERGASARSDDDFPARARSAKDVQAWLNRLWRKE
jgi:DNA helicase-2/ATP-dependent DNA helicase PcrA